MVDHWSAAMMPWVTEAITAPAGRSTSGNGAMAFSAAGPATVWELAPGKSVMATAVPAVSTAVMGAVEIRFPAEWVMNNVGSRLAADEGAKTAVTAFSRAGAGSA